MTVTCNTISVTCNTTITTGDFQKLLDTYILDSAEEEVNLSYGTRKYAVTPL
jgi:hypothetical protein